MTLSETYADFIHGLEYDHLPKQTKSQARKLVLDLVGVALAGYHLMDFPKQTVGYLIELGGKPESTVIGASELLPAPNAAFANAISAHALDMDDGHRFGALHPGTVVIPTAFAAAELVNASTKELLVGIIAGYEIMIRIGRAINPASLNRGFHSTGITGVFGAAAAASRIMGLHKEQIAWALGLAGLQASGVLQVNHDSQGAQVKPINPGRAAQSGVYASTLAQRGCKGPAEIFEGTDGFFQAFSDNVDKELAVQDLGSSFETDNVYLKLYAACRHAHAALDALLQAWPEERDPEEINEIVVETYSAAIRLAGIHKPETASAARFSIPFTLALGLRYRDAGANRYTEDIVKDELLLALAQKVQLVRSNQWDEIYPRKRGATVKIFTSHNTFSAKVDLAKGEPENPASYDEVQSKFLTNACLVLSFDEAKSFALLISEFEQVKLEEVTKFLNLAN